MSNRTKLLAAPQTDVLDRCCPIKRPDCLIPEIHLPRWNQIALYSKIPAKSEPKDPVVFTRPKLGKSLYRIFLEKDFDTHIRKDLSLRYNELHDPHLDRFYRLNRRNYIHLVKNNFITPYRDNVVCTQADFNHYRRYLRDLIAQEEILLRKAEEEAISADVRRYHAECFRRKQNRAWEWVKRALKKHKIHTMGRSSGLIPPTFDIADGEEDQAKISKQEEFRKIAKLVEERRMRTAIEHTEKVHERALAREQRKIDIEIEKENQKTALWQRMEAHELIKMKEIEKIQDKYAVNMKKRVQECTDRFDRIRRRDEKKMEAAKLRRREAQARKYLMKKDRTSLAIESGEEINISNNKAPQDELKNTIDGGNLLNTEENMTDDREPPSIAENITDDGEP